MMTSERKPLDIYIEQLPEIDDILDLQVPATFLLIRPDNIDNEVKTASGLIISRSEEVKMMTLARGVVVKHGMNCQEIRTDHTVFFYKNESKGSFRCKNSDGGWDVYQLYQEYSIHAYLKK